MCILSNSEMNEWLKLCIVVRCGAAFCLTYLFGLRSFYDIQPYPRHTLAQSRNVCHNPINVVNAINCRQSAAWRVAGIRKEQSQRHDSTAPRTNNGTQWTFILRRHFIYKCWSLKLTKTMPWHELVAPCISSTVCINRDSNENCNNVDENYYFVFLPLQPMRINSPYRLQFLYDGWTGGLGWWRPYTY